MHILSQYVLCQAQNSVFLIGFHMLLMSMVHTLSHKDRE